MPTETEIYAEIGRRYVQTVRLQNYVEQAIDGTLDFAANPGKEKKCTPGKSHFCRTPEGKGSCVSVKKQCKYRPDGVVKAAADYVQKSVSKFQTANSDQTNGSKKAITLNIGKLTKSKSASKSSTASSQQDKIDEKYASRKPSDQTIDGWQAETLKYHTSPEGLALQELTSRYHTKPGGIAWGEQPDYVRAINDRESFVRATIRSEQDKAARSKGNANSGKWESYSAYTAQEREKMQKKIANPRTKDAERVKLQKKLDEDRATSEAAAKRQTDKFNKSPEDRRRELEAEFDKTQKAKEAESKKLQEAIDKGDAGTIQRQMEEILRPMESYRDGDNDTSILDARQRQRQIIRDHLVAQSKKETPENVLGLNSDPSVEDVKRAYRAAARKAHPDAGGSQEEFQRVNNAFNRLRQRLDFAEFMELEIFKVEVLESIRNAD